MKKKTQSLLIIVTIILYLFAGCGNKSKETMPAYEVAATEEMILDEDISSSIAEPQEVLPIAKERKLVKEGNISFEVRNLEETQTRILNAVKKYSGYISSDTEEKEYNKIYRQVTIRVPSQKFDTLLSFVCQGVKYLDQKNIHVTDVTTQYFDLQIRIKNMKAMEERYLALLKQATKVSDMLEIESEIGKLRTEIESLEGTLLNLSNKVSFSTLQISYYKMVSVEASGITPEFNNALRRGWDSLVSFCVEIVSVWTFVLIIAIILFLFIRRKKKRKGQSKK